MENRLLEILPKLSPSYNVRVCCIREKGELAGEFEKAGIGVDLCYFRSRLHPLSLYQMVSYLKKVKAQIVHTHMYRPNISAVLAARLAGVPVIISNIHNVDHWDNRRQVKRDARFAPLRDKVIAVSQAVRQDYLSQTGTDPDKCVVIYNGINLERFHPREKDSALIEEFGLGGKKVVGMFARIVPQKDHHTFLKSAAIIKQEIPEVRFLIVGEEEGQTGLLKELQKQARELGLSEEAIFTGKRRDIPALLALCDVTVLSSLKEGFSNAVVESLAMGVPMVATGVGGNAEAILDGETGFIVPSGQPEPLAGRVIEILEQPAADMSARARERAKLFSLETMAANTDKLYRSLLAEKGII